MKKEDSYSILLVESQIRVAVGLEGSDAYARHLRKDSICGICIGNNCSFKYRK